MKKMGKFEDLTGQKFNRWTVIGRSSKNSGSVILWKCKCDCGNSSLLRGQDLKGAKSKSCGCLRKEVTIKRHGIKAF